MLGQHALAYTLLSFFAVTIHRRLLWFTVPSQAVQVLPLFVAAQAVSLVVRMIAGGMFPGWELMLAPVFEAAAVAGGDLAAAGAAAPRARPRREPAAMNEARTLTRSLPPRGRGRAWERPGARPPAMTELRNIEHELSRFRLRLLAAALFVLFAFACSRRGWPTCRSASTTSSRPRPRTTASRSCRSCPTAA